MPNDVFANGREISCKAASGKSVAAFPDVCLSPPSPPAGPVPIPYPTTAFAKDATSGSKTVKISKKEVMLKNKSYFKKCTGDEAATKSLGMGVVTHQTTGRVYFSSWSMDVKIEGENAVRHMDLTTHNHASIPGDTPTWPYLDEMSQSQKNAACKEEMEEVKRECKNSDKKGKAHKDCPKYTKSKATNSRYGENKCIKAKRCMLVPYDRAKSKGGCCPGQTPHHLVPKHHFAKFKPKYDENEAPCVCAEGHSWHRSDESYWPNAKKTHPMMHDIQDATERLYVDEGLDMHYDEAREIGIVSHKNTFPDSGCNEKCLRAQLDAYHHDKGVKDDSSMEIKATGVSELPDNIDEVWEKMDEHCNSYFGN